MKEDTDDLVQEFNENIKKVQGVLAHLKHRVVPASIDSLRSRLDGAVRAEEGAHITSEIVEQLKINVNKLETEFNSLVSLFRSSESKRAARENVERLISHDMKSQLLAASMITDMILKNESLSDKSVEMLSVLKSNAQQMVNLAGLATVLYSIETKSYKLKTDSVSVKEVLKEVIENNELLIGSKKVKVIIDTDMIDSQDVVPGEKVLLISAFNNLLVNALEASPQGSEINIRVYLSNGVKIVLSNPGSVPENIRKTFFEKYVTSGKIEGTGLGTYSAMMMIRAHHGDILLDTSKEGFTRIEVSLPSQNSQA